MDGENPEFRRAGCVAQDGPIGEAEGTETKRRALERRSGEPWSQVQQRSQ